MNVSSHFHGSASLLILNFAHIAVLAMGMLTSHLGSPDQWSFGFRYIYA